MGTNCHTYLILITDMMQFLQVEEDHIKTSILKLIESFLVKSDLTYYLDLTVWRLAKKIPTLAFAKT